MLEEGLPGSPVMPGFVAGTAFHCREDMHQARMGSPFFQDILNAVFLAKGFYFSNMLYLQSVLCGKLFCIVSDFPSQGLRKGGIIKDSDLVCIQKRGHALSIAPAGKSPPQDHPVIAGEDTMNLVFIAFGD
ncbi:hypothetical protein [Candidatus Hakubella thermalkaliphila]|uniref:hypothetical protein n=1 Tax=Candidatus Hakubella thermalkaliphila TaxID=2754717 RepID=UPI001C613332